ncbi:hypothetical protein [Streptomyces buecherae]|uniref:Uncharacterized protein n=1 Tax=Streptomyces buecherae TaxID=2763006 RepID=A0A7H8NGX1_9ACTN|nr:hypothetical protein [Streptomyces buecherae]QKW53636.1 hypothetical protein HUT08_33405 [Streptomyces buecherae]
MSAFDAGLTAVFTVWLAATVCAQLPATFPRWEKLLKFDVARLLPRYHFFAPFPDTYDYHLLVRVRSREGRPGPWREITAEPERTRWSAVWHPGRRECKLLRDLAESLRLSDPQCAEPGTLVSNPYLLLLNHAVAAVRTDSAATGGEVQFLIATTVGRAGANPPQPLFLSRHHRVPARPCQGP